MGHMGEYSPTCRVPLFGWYLFFHIYGTTFIFELSVPILSHVQSHPNMHYPFLAPARISEHALLR